MTQETAIPLVSIIIPHYNRPRTLADTLKNLLDQSFSDWEVIVVDDASPSDPTEFLAAIIPAPRCRVLRLEKNGGPSAARNAGIAAARGRFIAFLDSDDRWDSTKLEQQVAAALSSANPDRTLCYCRTRISHGEGQTSLAPERGIRGDENPADYLFLAKGFAQTSSIFIGRAAASEFSFDASLRQYEDYLFFIAARDHIASYIYIDEPLNGWNDEPRSDRLSRGAGRSITNADLFIQKAGTRLGLKARLAFLTTHVGVDILQQQPLRGLGLVGWAVAARAISPRYGLRQCLRALLGPERFAQMRGA
jgi:glycosyltransferase involved in cell wall biosynthesis